MQQILSALALVSGDELAVQRVGTGVGGVALRRILRDIIRILGSDLCAQGILCPEAALLISRRDQSLEDLPCLCELTLGHTVNDALVCDVIIHCTDGDDVGHSLGSGLMTVVRSLADQLFNRVIRNAVLAEVAVVGTLGDDIVVQGREALCIGLIAEVLLSRTLCGCSDGKKRAGCHCSCENCGENRS